MEKIWYVRHVRLPEPVRAPDIQRLVDASEVRAYRGGEVILGPHADHDLIYFVQSGQVTISSWREERTEHSLALLEPGDLFGSVYFVKTGRVKVSTHSPDGKEQILAFLQPGDLFGELVPAEPADAIRVEAFAPSIVCNLRRVLFEDVIRKTPEVTLQVIRVLARRLREAHQEIEDLALRDVPGRLASLLLRLAEGYGEEHERGMRLSFRLTHQDLAHMIGSTRETVTVTMSRFRDDGLISVERRTLIILDRERLSAVAYPRSG